MWEMLAGTDNMRAPNLQAYATKDDALDWDMSRPRGVYRKTEYVLTKYPLLLLQEAPNGLIRRQCVCCTTQTKPHQWLPLQVVYRVPGAGQKYRGFCCCGSLSSGSITTIQSLGGLYGG